ncbi:hypothetical protein DPMN_163524 [Dreissena polymorpha]|uniref:Uncharacterized protein n=1 Tax=Dreissena polymorpha TaxID=45954 RepID=A0A9D4IUI1_DREPO|nr:hypothetical protein DPMN_163524 [Dreissena polymorpha]
MEILDLLPPTNDALELHIKLANYQAKIWLNATDTGNDFQPDDSLDTGAWKLKEKSLKPVWMRKSKVPAACV